MTKRIAFFVEGYTEWYFVMEYLKEIISKKGFTFRIFSGKYGSPSKPRKFTSITTSGKGTKYEALIYVSGTDSQVNSDILDQCISLHSKGTGLIIGLKDLRGNHKGIQGTLKNLPIFERADKFTFRTYPYVKSIIAVMEIETWFIGETNHYQRIDAKLTKTLIQSNKTFIGLDPYSCVYEKIEQPAETLRDIYRLAGETYSKNRKRTKRTVKSLDYVNMYYNEKGKISKLSEFIDAIDNFF